MKGIFKSLCCIGSVGVLFLVSNAVPNNYKFKTFVQKDTIINLSYIINHCPEIKTNYRFKKNSNFFSIGSMVHGNSTTGDPHNYKYYCKDFKNAGLSIVRIEPCKEMYYFQQEGIDIVAYMRYPDKETLLKYNGDPNLAIDGEMVGINVTYWEFCNELDVNYWRKELSIDDIFNRLKNAYLYAKSIRSDIKVVLGAPANITSGDYMDKLCSYTDKDNKHIWDYCDVFNIHCYPIEPEGIIRYLKKLESLMNVVHTGQFSYLSEKEIWITECGFDSFRHTEEFQGRSLAPMYLTAFSYGVSKVINYCYLYSEGYSFNTESELYYGIVHEGIDNSYVSFLRNDGEFKNSLAKGEALLYKPIYKSDQYKQLSLSKTDDGCLEQITNSGLVISGSGYTIKEVSILSDGKEYTIWGERFVVSDLKGLVLNKTYFNNIKKGDIIKVYVSDVINTNRKYIINRPKPAYYAIKQLSNSITNDICLYKNDNYSLAVINKGNTINYIVWSNTLIKVDSATLATPGLSILDYMGRELNSEDSSKGPYYIKKITNGNN